MWDDEQVGEFTAADPLHNLITLFADTTEGGPLDILLQENGSAILQEDSSYILI